MKEYRNSKGELHRLDGPAIIHADGSKTWFQNDQVHRLDGPAIERADGNRDWFIRGNEISCEVESWLEENQFTSPLTDKALVLFVQKFGG